MRVCGGRRGEGCESANPVVVLGAAVVATLSQGSPRGRAAGLYLDGTPGPDVKHGTPGDDVLCGMGGDDKLYGGRGTIACAAGGATTS